MGRLYAGETITFFNSLKDDLNRTFTPPPGTNVTFEVLDKDDAVVLAETAATRQRKDNGTASSAAAKSLTDSTKAWTPNQWVGLLVRITGGTGSGQERRIKSNTATVLTLEDGSEAGQGAWATNPDATSTYDVHEAKYEYGWASPAGQKDAVLTVVARAKDAAYTSIEKWKLRLE